MTMCTHPEWAQDFRRMTIVQPRQTGRTALSEAIHRMIMDQVERELWQFELVDRELRALYSTRLQTTVSRATIDAMTTLNIPTLQDLKPGDQFDAIDGQVVFSEGYTFVERYSPVMSAPVLIRASKKGSKSEFYWPETQTVRITGGEA